MSMLSAIARAGTEPISPIYQVLLSQKDIDIFENPRGQPAKDPLNCASVSLYLLRLIDTYQAEYNAPRTEGLHISEIVNYIKTKHQYKINFTEDYRKISIFGLMFFNALLFEGFATIVLATRTRSSIGHYFVLYKHEGELYALDAQAKEGYRGLYAIQEYLKNQGLDDSFYFILGPPGTKEYYTALYIDTLSDLFTECSIANEGGGKRLKHSKRKTRKQRKLKKQKKRKTYRN